MRRFNLVVRHARLATMGGPQSAAGEAPLALLDDGALAIDGAQIAWIGPDARLPEHGAQEIDAAGALLTPGFIEPHSHLLFAGDRASEHAARLAGQSYLEIAQRGGGILATVRATRSAPDDHLVAAAQERLRRLVRSGVTTAEVKSGYGLSVDQELRLLRLIRDAGQGAGCEVVPTLLGLHAVPPEMDRADWVRAAAGELTQAAVAEGLAHGCDAFCEAGAFTAAECREVLEAGARAGLVPHLHADQLTDSFGAQLAAQLRCASADHLDRTGPPGIEALARSGTVAVLLPLAAWFLREQQPARARPFLAAGVPVALGGNCNPGSQRIESMSLLLAAGCLISGLTPAQALWACTAGAAQALRLPDRGRLAVGLRADLVLHATPDPAHLPYHAGVEHARVVITHGQVVLDLRHEPAPRCD